MFIVTIVALILNLLCLRVFAKEELYLNGFVLTLGIFVSIIPYVNIIALIVFAIWVAILKIENIDVDIDEFAKKIFFVKDKKDDDNFKGKGYR
jgi:hypothetical protein